MEDNKKAIKFKSFTNVKVIITFMCYKAAKKSAGIRADNKINKNKKGIGFGNIVYKVKSRAHGRNNVGEQLPTLMENNASVCT